MLLWFNNKFGGTLRTGINLATRACKAIATGAVGKVALNGGAAIMAKNYLNQFVH